MCRRVQEVTLESIKITPLMCDGAKKVERGLNVWIYEMTVL